MTADTKPCPTCMSAVPTGARKCLKCGDYQSLAARLAAGFDLKSLLALLPLLTLIYAFLAERLQVPKSALGVTAVECQSHRASLFASNPGNRVALLRSIHFAVAGDSGDAFTLPGPESRVFQPGEARLIPVTVDRRSSPGGLVSFQQRQQKNCVVKIETIYLTHDKREQKEVTSCSCPDA